MHDDIEDTGATGSRFADKRIDRGEVDGGLARLFVFDSVSRTGVKHGYLQICT